MERAGRAIQGEPEQELGRRNEDGSTVVRGQRTQRRAVVVEFDTVRWSGWKGSIRATRQIARGSGSWPWRGSMLRLSEGAGGGRLSERQKLRKTRLGPVCAKYLNGCVRMEEMCGR